MLIFCSSCLLRLQVTGAAAAEEEARINKLRPLFRSYAAAGRYFPVFDFGSLDATLSEARKPFLPQLVVLIGASGSGRGEFSGRCVVAHRRTMAFVAWSECVNIWGGEFPARSCYLLFAHV